MTRKLLLSILIVFTYSIGAFAQSVALGSIRLEESTRDFQLLGKIPADYSFNNRPFHASKSIPIDSIYRWMDSSFFDQQKLHHHIVKKKWASLQILPIDLLQQYNSNTPYGYNNGSLPKASGYQQLARAGIFASAGPLQIQLQPEWVYAQNSNYPITGEYGSANIGPQSLKYLGQSSISLNLNALSVGVSTQNHWYGPGINNSLLMSYNAPGFAHFYFGTHRPFRTAIGSFEWSLLAGRLSEDSTFAYENSNLHRYAYPQRTMYYNGMVFSYHPKWLNGLHVGFSRAFVVPEPSLETAAYDNSSFTDKYLPVFTVVQKQNILLVEDQKARDQQISLFMRWVLPQEHMEWYGEYGWNDHSLNIRDFYMGPGHSSAYLVGMKKIVPMKKESYFSFQAEYMRTEQLPEYMVRDAGNWNRHGYSQSFTQSNQLLGSAIGPGNNVFNLICSWNKGWKRYLFGLEKLQQDPLYYSAKWTQMVITAGTDYNYKHWVLQTQLKWVKEKNYGWQQDNLQTNIFATVGIKYFL